MFKTRGVGSKAIWTMLNKLHYWLEWSSPPYNHDYDQTWAWQLSRRVCKFQDGHKGFSPKSKNIYVLKLLQIILFVLKHHYNAKMVTTCRTGTVYRWISSKEFDEKVRKGVQTWQLRVDIKRRISLRSWDGRRGLGGLLIFSFASHDDGLCVN